jgi:hypothetical protein
VDEVVVGEGRNECIGGWYEERERREREEGGEVVQEWKDQMLRKLLVGRSRPGKACFWGRWVPYGWVGGAGETP